jgi:AhpC/TSA family
MYRTVGGVLLLLLAMPPLWAADKPKDKPLSPKEQYQALLKEQSDAMKAFSDAYRQAKTDEEKNKIFQEKYPQAAQAAPKFLELAEKNAKDPVAIDALVWVMNNGSRGKDPVRAKAVAQLLRDHVQSDKMSQVCSALAQGNDKEGTDLLRAVLEKNTNKDALSEASLALAQRLSNEVTTARFLKDHPENVERHGQFYGKDYVDELLKADIDKVQAEGAKLYKDIGDKYVPDMKADRVVQLCQRLGQSGGEASEGLLRSLLEKDKRRDVQGVACLALAMSLKERADQIPDARTKDREKLSKESEQLFERAIETYGDVKTAFRGTVADQAKGVLFELKFLSIGKPVPDIEGEDGDSKKFKLSDYRGKVVMLDFWGHW